MNEFLAGIYNTREAIGASQDTSDVEKLAEAQLLDEALQAEGVDINRLPGDTILKLAHELFGDNSALVKSAAEEPPPFEKKEEEEKSEESEDEEVKQAALAELRARSQGQDESMEEKVAQADFLGRVMAHSYWNEKTAIEKTAGRKLERTLGGSTVGGLKGMAAGGLGGAALGAGIGALKGGKKGALHGAVLGGTGGLYAGNAAGSVVGGVKGYRAAKAEEEKHPDLKGESKKKKASAIDTLAEKRAMEWAAAHGLLEQADPEEEKLASAVDQRALEMLMEAGVDVAAVEAAAAK